jgi:hypothetical protein
VIDVHIYCVISLGLFLASLDHLGGWGVLTRGVFRRILTAEFGLDQVVSELSVDLLLLHLLFWAWIVLIQDWCRDLNQFLVRIVSLKLFRELIYWIRIVLRLDHISISLFPPITCAKMLMNRGWRRRYAYHRLREITFFVLGLLHSTIFFIFKLFAYWVFLG